MLIDGHEITADDLMIDTKKLTIDETRAVSRFLRILKKRGDIEQGSISQLGEMDELDKITVILWMAAARIVPGYGLDEPSWNRIGQIPVCEIESLSDSTASNKTDAAAVEFTGSLEINSGVNPVTGDVLSPTNADA